MSVLTILEIWHCWSSRKINQIYKTGKWWIIFEKILSRKRDEETKNSEETGISFRQSMVQIVYDMNCVSVSGLRAVHRFSIFKTAIKAWVRPGIGHTTFGFKNLLPVLPGKSKMAFKNRFLAQIITIGRIFEIQTVSTQVR